MATITVLNQNFEVRESDDQVPQQGIAVQPGDHFDFTATGQIWAGVWFTGQNGPQGWPGPSTDPKFPAPGLPAYSLIGIMNEQYFFIGPALHIDYPPEAPSTTLFIMINDDVHGNGSGAFNVQVVQTRDLPVPQEQVDAEINRLIEALAADRIPPT
jgi:hypothetical protein